MGRIRGFPESGGKRWWFLLPMRGQKVVEFSQEPSAPPQGLGGCRSWGALGVLGGRKRQRAGALQDAGATSDGFRGREQVRWEPGAFEENLPELVLTRGAPHEPALAACDPWPGAIRFAERREPGNFPRSLPGSGDRRLKRLFQNSVAADVSRRKLKIWRRQGSAATSF